VITSSSRGKPRLGTVGPLAAGQAEAASVPHLRCHSQGGVMTTPTPFRIGLLRLTDAAP
jgi:hypothetical protein